MCKNENNSQKPTQQKTSATTQDHEIGILYSQRNIDVAQICGNTQKYSVKCTFKKKSIAGEKKKSILFWYAEKMV